MKDLLQPRREGLTEDAAEQRDVAGGVQAFGVHAQVHVEAAAERLDEEIAAIDVDQEPPAE